MMDPCTRRGALSATGRAAAILIGLLALTSPAAAQVREPDAATLEAARALGRAGLKLYDQGDCRSALEKFEQAYALYKAPTIGLMSARCAARLGRLAAAEARYREVIELALGDAPPPPFQQAKQDAAREHRDLLPRVPRLTIVVELPGTTEPTPQVTVRLDGEPLGADGLGAPRLVEVGAHEVEGERGDAKVRERVELREGEHRRVVLRLDPADPSKSRAKDEQVEAAPIPGAAQRAVGWAAVGVGAAGLVAGAVVGGLAVGKRGDLDAQGCRDGLCPDALQGDVNSYNTMRTISGVSLIAGAALAAGGAALVLTAPSAPPPAGAGQGSRPRLLARVGLGVIGVEGTF